MLTEVCTTLVLVILCQTGGPPIQTGNSGFVLHTSGSEMRIAGEDTHHTELQGISFSNDSVIRQSY